MHKGAMGEREEEGGGVMIAEGVPFRRQRISRGWSLPLKKGVCHYCVQIDIECVRCPRGRYSKIAMLRGKCSIIGYAIKMPH